MSRAMRVIRLENVTYVRVDDVEEWLTERALDQLDPRSGEYGVFAATLLGNLKRRFARAFLPYAKAESDVIPKPGKVIRR